MEVECTAVRVWFSFRMSGFDASQYAFFGGGDDAALDGGLGDGALDVDEGPVADGAPVEEVEITNDDDEALAEAVMARLALGAGGGAGAAPMPHQQLTMPHPPVPPFAPPPVRVPGVPLWLALVREWHGFVNPFRGRRWVRARAVTQAPENPGVDRTRHPTCVTWTSWSLDARRVCVWGGGGLMWVEGRGWCHPCLAKRWTFKRGAWTAASWRHGSMCNRGVHRGCFAAGLPPDARTALQGLRVVSPVRSVRARRRSVYRPRLVRAAIDRG